MQRQDQSFGQLRTSLSPDYLNFENDLLVNELKSTVKNKMNRERIDRVAISGKLDHEKYLLPDSDKMNNYFESKVGLNNIYDRDMKTVSPALVRGEMNEVLKPLKRRRRKKDKYFRGYDTGDSRSMSDANAFGYRSKMNGHRNTIRDKRLVDGSEGDLVETTEAETTDYEKRGFVQHRLRSSSALNSRHRHKPSGTSLVETIGDYSEAEMGLLSSAAGRYQSDKEPNFLKRFGEERSGQASRVRSGSEAEEVHYLEEDLTRAERKIESLKQEVSRLQLKNSDKRKKNAVSTDPNSVLVEGQSRDVDLDLRNLRLMQELKNEEVESKVANRVADIIEQVHGEQKKRDDALLKQVREARSEREQLIKQIEALKKQVQFLQKPKEEQLTDVIGDDSQPSIDGLLEQIENASSGFDIEKAGAVLLDRVMKTKETVAHIRDEELQHVVAERNQATEKLKDMELYFFSVDKFSSSTPKDRQINTAPIVPSDDRVNRALKTELQQAARARDEALKHSDVLQQELNAIKDYLGKSGPPGEALLEDLGEKFSRGQDPVVSHLERLTQDLSDKLKLSENARVENEKSLIANEAKSAQLTKRNEELERLVSVLRNKLSDSPSPVPIYHPTFHPHNQPEISYYQNANPNPRRHEVRNSIPEINGHFYENGNHPESQNPAANNSHPNQQSSNRFNRDNSPIEQYSNSERSLAVDVNLPGSSEQLRSRNEGDRIIDPYEQNYDVIEGQPNLMQSFSRSQSVM